MLFTLTLLRDKGKRLDSPESVHSDACLHTEMKAGFTYITVSSYHGGPSHKVKPLFEPKIRSFDQNRIHLIGFESMPTGESFVQEWLLTAGQANTMSNWGGGSRTPSPAHTRLE